MDKGERGSAVCPQRAPADPGFPENNSISSIFQLSFVSVPPLILKRSIGNKSRIFI